MVLNIIKSTNYSKFIPIFTELIEKIIVKKLKRIYGKNNEKNDSNSSQSNLKFRFFLMINEMNIELKTALLVMKLNEFETNDTYV